MQSKCAYAAVLSINREVPMVFTWKTGKVENSEYQHRGRGCRKNSENEKKTRWKKTGYALCDISIEKNADYERIDTFEIIFQKFISRDVGDFYFHFASTYTNMSDSNFSQMPISRISCVLEYFTPLDHNGERMNCSHTVKFSWKYFLSGSIRPIFVFYFVPKQFDQFAIPDRAPAEAINLLRLKLCAHCSKSKTELQRFYIIIREIIISNRSLQNDILMCCAFDVRADGMCTCRGRIKRQLSPNYILKR